MFNGNNCVIYLVVIVLTCVSYILCNTVVVDTTYGPVIGLKRISRLNDKIISFRGVPYAKPPVGPLRFTDPQPPEPWFQPRDATKPGNTPVAIDKLFDDGTDQPISKLSNEDCLNLNVYTKNLYPRTLRPVMVWIYGGAFKLGNADDRLYGADYLMKHNIVHVAMNYRVGALGFLSIADPDVGVPGNAGLKDQSLALRWVRDNIEQFGGDPDNVTIFGESAGSVSVHFHMCSEMSRGLFHRAIMQSGSMFSAWARNPNNNWGSRLATKLGWNGEGGSQNAVDYLRTVDAVDIFRAQDSILDPSELMEGIATFGPVPEPYRSDQTFYDVEPEELVQSCWATDVPLLIGANADEGYLTWKLFAKQAAFFQSPDGVNALVPANVRRAKGEQVRQRVLDYYYNYSKPAIDDFQSNSKMWGDRTIWQPILDAVEARLSNTDSSIGAPTYLYRFSKDSRILNMIKLAIMGVDIPGTCHADEILYLFLPANAELVEMNSPERIAIQRMIEIWTHFAATGNPATARSVDDLNWEPASASDFSYYKGLIINDELTVDEFPESERAIFWREILTIQ